MDQVKIVCGNAAHRKRRLLGLAARSAGGWRFTITGGARQMDAQDQPVRLVPGDHEGVPTLKYTTEPVRTKVVLVCPSCQKRMGRRAVSAVFGEMRGGDVVIPVGLVRRLDELAESDRVSVLDLEEVASILGSNKT